MPCDMFLNRELGCLVAEEGLLADVTVRLVVVDAGVQVLPLHLLLIVLEAHRLLRELSPPPVKLV